MTRMMHKWLGLAALAAAGLLAGCSQTEGPEPVQVFRHSYLDDVVVSVAVDTVLLEIGTGWWIGDAEDTTRVFIDAAGSPDDLLRMDLHIVGSSYDRNDEARIEHRWRGDTLQVWCGFTAPWQWGGHGAVASEGDKTSYAPPWFRAERIDVALPPGTALRYVGYWIE